MASQPPEYLHPQQGPIRRPKLTYRTKLGGGGSVNSMASGSSNPASPFQSEFCPSLRFPPSLASDTSSSSFSIDPSTSTASLPSKPQADVSKKRSGFLSGLLGAKEPSAQALADYQKQLMKQGNGRVTVVGLPGVSSAKLPPTVPKTNSKWDGVPQTVKEREKYHERSKRYSSSGLCRTASSAESMRSDTRTASTPVSRKRESRGGASVLSNGSKNNLAELYGWELRGHSSGESVREKDSAAEGSRPSTSGTTFSFNAPTLQRDSRFAPRETPKIVRTETENSSLTMSGALTPPEYSNSPTLTPADPSPVTPGAPSRNSNHRWPHNNENTEDYFKTTILDVPTLGTEVIVKSAGVNVLGPPATVKRRPKPSINQSDGENRKVQELDFQHNSILKDPVASKETPSPRSATASTPNTPTKSNFMRKGLGLAKNLKYQQSLSPRPTADDSNEDGRMVTATPEGSQSMRRKSWMSLVAH